MISKAILIKYFKLKFKRLIYKFISIIDRNYYFRLHLCYFVVLGFIGSILIKIIEIEVPFVDCLYISYSSMTTTGLISTDISKWSPFTLFILLCLVQLGSSVLLTLPLVLLRRFFIRNAYANQNSSTTPFHLSTPHLISTILSGGSHHHELSDNEDNNIDQHRHNGGDDDDNGNYLDDYSHGNYLNHDGDGNEHEGHIHHINGDIEIGGILHMDSPIRLEDDNLNTPIIEKSKITTTTSSSTSISNNVISPPPLQLSPSSNSPPIQPKIKDSSTSVEIQQQQSNNNEVEPSTDYNNNLEYRSLGKLLVIIPAYILIIYILAFFSIGLTIQFSESAQNIMKNNNTNGWWWTFFHIISAFNNAGIALFPDSLNQINNQYFLLISLSILIFFGNTLFPFFLRYIIKIISRFTKDPDPYYNLLENPRSIFTHLFPYRETMQLFIVWIIFNVSQILLMGLLDVNDKAFAGMSRSTIILNYYFSSITTRTCGFNSVDISLLSESVLVLFLGLMFVSSYPFIISMRRTSVNSKYSNQGREVMKDILIRDIFIPYICILLIAICENHILESEKFSIFEVLFETISAFGSVGLTISPISFHLSIASKLIMVFIMIAGRHRNLPESVDDSINPKNLRKHEIISRIITRYKRRSKF